MDRRLNELLQSIDIGLFSEIGEMLSLSGDNINYIDLENVRIEGDEKNDDMYDNEQSVEIYRNFLNWLFATFKTDEHNFRKGCLNELGLKEGDRVLITSCGLGEDVEIACELVGESGFVHAQDLSGYFIRHASNNAKQTNVVFTVSNALDLPYKDNYFEAVYHFGGINLFGDIGKAVGEMNRVCKIGGRVVFGDESVARHLTDTDYGKMFIENNQLWAEGLPLKHLPQFSDDIFLRYVLGNCFYLIGYRKAAGYPDVDIDIEHIGYRGGSVRKRYFGKIEGIDLKLKDKIYRQAKETGNSVTSLLENLIRKHL